MALVTVCSTVLSLLTLAHWPLCRIGWSPCPEPRCPSTPRLRKILINRTRHVDKVQVSTPARQPSNRFGLVGASGSRKVAVSRFFVSSGSCFQSLAIMPHCGRRLRKQNIQQAVPHTGEYVTLLNLRISSLASVRSYPSLPWFLALKLNTSTAAAAGRPRTNMSLCIHVHAVI